MNACPESAYQRSLFQNPKTYILQVIIPVYSNITIDVPFDDANSNTVSSFFCTCSMND